MNDVVMADKVDSIYEIPFETIDEKPVNLEQYKNKVLMIVNVASKCGFTRQYKDLEKLYQEYKDKGLVVLGFPCNQFLSQESKDNAQIKQFACEKYGVTFPMFAKLNVRGKSQHLLYKYLKENMEEKPRVKFIPWNFSKILVDRQGNVKKRYAPTTGIDNIKKEIEKLL